MPGPLPVRRVLYEVVTEERFPRGLACGVCRRKLEPGQPFHRKLWGMREDGTALELIVCVYC